MVCNRLSNIMKKLACTNYDGSVQEHHTCTYQLHPQFHMLNPALFNSILQTLSVFSSFCVLQVAFQRTQQFSDHFNIMVHRIMTYILVDEYNLSIRAIAPASAISPILCFLSSSLYFISLWLS
jgi:hypothetical protein